MPAGFAATALLTVTFFQFGVGIATSRDDAVGGVPPHVAGDSVTRLAGRVLSALAFAAATVGVVAVVGTTVYGAQLPAWRFAALVVALLLGSIPFALLGIAFGYWLPPRGAAGREPRVPPARDRRGACGRAGDDCPTPADVASQLLPTRSWMEVLDSVATGDDPLPLHHVAALAGWAVAFGALAWWGYRRDEGERFR